MLENLNISESLDTLSFWANRTGVLPAIQFFDNTECIVSLAEGDKIFIKNDSHVDFKEKLCFFKRRNRIWIYETLKVNNLVC